MEQAAVLEVWSKVAAVVTAALATASAAHWLACLSLVYSSLFLKPRVARRMVAMVEDWSSVSTVLDAGCGSGLLLATVALKLQKEGCGGRVVGVDHWPASSMPARSVPYVPLPRISSKVAAAAAAAAPTISRKSMSATLRNAVYEGVDRYVTCKSGDLRQLPFPAGHFDIVFSSLALNRLSGKDLGKQIGRCTDPAVGCRAAVPEHGRDERRQALAEFVRVLKPGGTLVLWDILHGPEYAAALKELGLEGILLSRCIFAFLTGSYIVFGRKPKR
eukprot:SM000224S07111  [mRNA]  locus=s224:142461:143701:- [translate_table: standard]